MKRIVTALAVTVSVTSGVAYAQTAAELLQKAIYLEDSVGDVAQAVAYYRRLLEVLPPNSELAATARRRLEAARNREEHQAAPLTASHAAHLVVATPTPAQVRPSTRTASDRVWFQTLPAHEIVVGKDGPVLSDTARVIAMGVTLRELVAFAYGHDSGSLTRSQVLNGPEWMDTARWDVRVPVPADAGPPLVIDEDGVVTGGAGRLLLQQLLAERFNLQVQRTKQPLAVYDMVSTGPGPDLKPSTAACVGDEPSQRCEWRSGVGFVTVQGQTMRHLAVQLSWNFPAITIPVRDRSGLTGKFDYTVSYVPTLLAAPNRAQGNVENPAAASGPSIVQVLHERLGLRLIERVDTLDVIVITNAQKPS